MRNGKLHKRPRESRLKNFPADYVGSFYRTLADNVDNFVGSDFYGGIANDSNIPLRFRQRHTNNHNLTRDRINNASFRQRLDPISKNIIRRQNPLELVFEDISNLDAENPIIGSLLRELNVKKKALASDLVKNAPNAPEKYFEIQKRLDRSRGVRYIKSKNDNKNNNNLSPPPSPPPGRRSFLAPPPPPQFQPSYSFFDSSFQPPPPPPRSDISLGNFDIPAQQSSANFSNRDRELSANLFASQIATLTREKKKKKLFRTVSSRKWTTPSISCQVLQN